MNSDKRNCETENSKNCSKNSKSKTDNQNEK